MENENKMERVILGKYNRKLIDDTEYRVGSLENAKVLIANAMKDGVLYSEEERPRKREDETMESFISRYSIINSETALFKLSDFEVNEEEDGVIVISAIATKISNNIILKPLEFPSFALRCFANFKIENGNRVNEIVKIVSWDYIGHNPLEVDYLR